MDTLYRPVEGKDFAEIYQMLEDDWGYNRPFEDHKMGHVLRFQFLDLTLKNSSYGQVAVKDGKVLGVIFGRANHHPPYQALLRQIPKDIFLQIAQASSKDQQALVEYFDEIDTAHDKLLERYPNQADSSIELFIVSKAARGLGVGGTLLANFEKYLKAENVRRTYLFTDTECNHQYYQVKGYDQKSEYKHPTRLGQKAHNYTYYLYEKEWTNESSN